MKKILTMALCLTVAGTMSAQKFAVDQAEKLSGKADKIAEARSLLKQAAENPETANDVRTYYTGGKVEYAAYDDAYKKLAINQNDPSLDFGAMGEELVNGYNQYLKALPFDSVPNVKGEIKPKYAKKMISEMLGHYNDYYQIGGMMLNKKLYTPTAYELFTIHASMADQPWASKQVKAVHDTIRANSYYLAGRVAHAANMVPEAIAAFQNARKLGYTNSENDLYELSCWQSIAANDSTQEAKAKEEIEKVARHGYETYGLGQDLFFKNLVISAAQQNKFDEALGLLNTEIAKNPELSWLYGVRSYVYELQGNDEAAITDYRKAASFENADFDTLRVAAGKLLNAGAEKWDAVSSTDKAAREAIRAEYWIPAKAIAERAKNLKPDDRRILNIIDRIDYVLETFFQ